METMITILLDYLKPLGMVFCLLLHEKVYIPFCIETSMIKRFLVMGFVSTVKQLASVKREIEKLKENTYPWYPRSYKDRNDCNDYASRLYLRTGASFFKIKKDAIKHILF